MDYDSQSKRLIGGETSRNEEVHWNGRSMLKKTEEGSRNISSAFISTHHRHFATAWSALGGGQEST
jgi:hypothetical protein